MHVCNVWGVSKVIVADMWWVNSSYSATVSYSMDYGLSFTLTLNPPYFLEDILYTHFLH